MNAIRATLALASVALVTNVHAISTNDIQLWTGSGTNRAAMVIEWNPPLVYNNTTVPAPVTCKTLVWGYQFNGAATGTQMFNSILASDPRLYAVVNNQYGTFVESIGYNLNGNGLIGVTDGNLTFNANAFTGGILLNPSLNLNVDGIYPLNSGDLFWSGLYGPNWNVWNELDDSGGFAVSPERGTSPYWNSDSGIQGQWEFSNFGLDDMPLYDGSWIGFSVAAAGYDTDTNDPATAVFNLDEQAPPSPDGTYVAYVGSTNDFAVQVVSSSGVDPEYPYNDPTAILGPPTLTFVDIFDGDTTNRTSIIDPAYWLAPAGSDVITEIASGGQITVMMGRKVCHNPINPYGIDLMVFGYAWFEVRGDVSDSTDLDATQLSRTIYNHPTTVSVSPDGTNWYTFPNTPGLFPDNAYRWDEANQSWTGEQFNPTKPLNPTVYATDFAGQTVASGLDQFIGSAGGTGYDLGASGFPSIQYVRVQPGPGTYTVIDAIAAVNPAVEGDALSITPGNISSCITNLAFQKPDDTSRNLISVSFSSVSEAAKVSTVALSDFSPFAQVPGSVCSAYQITVTPMSGTTAVTFNANIALSAGDSYSGDGSDLRVLQWDGTGWNVHAFTFNASSNLACVTGLTNLSAFVVTRLSPQLSLHSGVGGFYIPLTPFANVTYMLQRSTDLVTWACVSTITPTSEQPVTLQDPNPMPSLAFYRVEVNP
ncbi:MAG: hypothetical protein ABSA83_20865 [Verrucomicrobiota bacterium]|jgi:hypothetical protein